MHPIHPALQTAGIALISYIWIQAADSFGWRWANKMREGENPTDRTEFWNKNASCVYGTQLQKQIKWNNNNKNTWLWRTQSAENAESPWQQMQHTLMMETEYSSSPYLHVISHSLKKQYKCENGGDFATNRVSLPVLSTSSSSHHGSRWCSLCNRFTKSDEIKI